MKKILGLDLGTNSIGWAVVNEAENAEEQSSIVKLGVRTIHYDNFVSTDTGKECMDAEKDFSGGKSISCNAGRTKNRSARRNLQRYKLRRQNLIEVLQKNGFISDEALLSENGTATTFQTYRLRAKSATEKISLEEFSRVLLMINKKRGYKSSRKAKSTDEGQLIDGMAIAKELYERNLTPGEFSLELLLSGKKRLPDYYISDLRAEFCRVWKKQKEFYPSILTDELYDALQGKNKTQTWGICSTPFQIKGIKRTTKDLNQKIETYQWRVHALNKKLGLEELAIVLQEINGQASGASGYLGAISDRSKELFFNKQTVGQYQMAELDNNPNYSLKKQVFYRQDYLDEFETIWETQAQYHKELTAELKKEIRDVVIFYQRPLKSQKGLISFCEFESRQIQVEIEGKKIQKTVGLRVCPKSSPLFQQCKIWQILNNSIITDTTEKTKRELTHEEKTTLFGELNFRNKMSKTDVLKTLFKNPKGLELNYKEIEGNRTQADMFSAYQTIVDISGHGEYDFSKMRGQDIYTIVKDVFRKLGINTDILDFDALKEGKDFEQQAMFQLWHLLYSFEGDKSATGNKKLIQKLQEAYGFNEEYAAVMASIVFPSDYGSLSTKAMRKIVPHLMDGLEYSVACEYAGYRHSKKSLTKEELDKKVYKDKLELLPRNSLRNPVVEKILNQMVNVVNQVVDTYGKPNEIRIELARELKKSSQERKELTIQISNNSRLHEQYKAMLQKEFRLANVSRNDIVRYKLYLELEPNGFHTLYTNTYIPQEKLFSKDFDIEHIIPQAKLFDDSFSNKTLETRTANIAKSNSTALDYVALFGEDKLKEYKKRIEDLYKNGKISKTKHDKLLMTEAEIPSGFINRDLRDSQYIAKKAREILEEMVPFVVPTTGSITDRLREDWQLVDVMQELNWDKYNKLGLTEYFQDKDGRKIPRIKDWSKRNDHRHHAMDALTISFTKRGIIQYLNNLNARVQKGADVYLDLDNVELSDLSKEERSAVIYAIEQKELYRDKHNKLRFKSPMPLVEFRTEAKQQLENILISVKAKNKVTTHNINITKTQGGKNKRIQNTPRGQLHLETVYGSQQQYVTKEEKVGAAFNDEKIQTVASKKYREALLKRLQEYNGDSTMAFTGKNSLAKNPIFIDDLQSMQVPEKVKTVTLETSFSIRKPISPDLKLEKVIDCRIKKVLEARLQEYGGDAKKAFVNLDENPIYVNKDKGITIKRVTLSGIANGTPLHSKRDKEGNLIFNAEGNAQPVDFVNTGNNHHVAIFQDLKGQLQEHVVTFFEATERANQELPIIDKTYKKDEGWQFLFTMKQNEFFVFPNAKTGFDPNEIDLLDANKNFLISPNLYRVQKISTNNYMFRHHLETTVEESKTLRDVSWKNIRSENNLKGIVKVRVNHIGQIVSVGEY